MWWNSITPGRYLLVSKIFDVHLSPQYRLLLKIPQKTIGQKYKYRGFVFSDMIKDYFKRAF